MFTILSVTISAIDTPWLPLTPDGEMTTGKEEQTDAEKTDFLTESKEESTILDGNIPDENNDDAVQPSDSEKTSDEEIEKTGCGSVIGMCTMLITSVCAVMVCVQKARKENL